MSRTEIARQARLDYILAAARRLFAAKDPAACTMEDIAEAAEYTRRALYFYFRNRDELYLTIHTQDLARRRRWQQRAVAAACGGRERILAWARALYEFCRDHPQAQRMEAYWDFQGVDPERISPEIFARFRKLNDQLAADLRQMFQEGAADGTLRADLPLDSTISQFVYSLRAVIGRALSSGYTFAVIDPDVYVAQFLDLFGRGIGNQGAT